MRDLFDQLLREGENGIERLVLERRQENVDLEFKEKADPSSGEISRQDKHNLAETLSAFSNSMGGLVVWGVKARKNLEGVDCATERKPIIQIEKFQSDITTLISDSLMPRHDGIRVDIVKAATAPGAGYLLILIERSERRPHRAELGVGRYFKRSGDNTIRMEHYDIEDSFKRLIMPSLEIRTEVRNTAPARIGNDARVFNPSINLYLRNPSPATARFPFLILKDIRGIDRNFPLGSMSGLVCRSQNGEQHFLGGADIVIHPELELLVTGFLIPPIKAARGADSQFHVIDPDQVIPVTAQYRCGCYNSRQSVGELVILPQEFLPHSWC